MLISIAYMLLLGLLLGWICEKLKLPRLVGMILTGIILGPNVANLIDGSILGISSELRKIALIIILIRAGLSLDLDDLKKAGRPAILMCFVPACFEIFGMWLFAPKILGISSMDALLMGSIVAAISPAVIVPKCLKLMEEGYGVEKSIPQMILAGASVDDVFVIVIFTSIMSLMQGKSVSAISFINIPLSIILGILVGWCIGLVLAKYFKKFHIRDTLKVVIILSIAFILVTIEDKLTTTITFSALIAIMSTGIFFKKEHPIAATRLSSKFNKLWIVAEIILFVLVGASVNLKVMSTTGLKAIILIILVTMVRTLGVFVSLYNSKLNFKEKLFVMVAYTPKATVQAAIGGLPLAAGLACGNIVLAVALVSILLTAPVGSMIIDVIYKSCLMKVK